MAEHGALATLKDLAEKEVEDAARLLGEMRRGCQQAEEQLKMLIDYQNEYRNNLNSDMSAGMTSNRWINYQQFIQTLEKGAQPLREFMLRQTREADLGLFARLANTGPLQGPEAVPMRILLPAYVTSELKTAFQIGFTIFIPFLIIDLVIASVLMALGMMMVPPATIALPFKLMLFVLVDGWQLLVGSLAQSFYS